MPSLVTHCEPTEIVAGSERQWARGWSQPAIFLCPCRGGRMYISSKASRIRQREAQRARDNRAEIVKALSQGQITRRDLLKWGILTTSGVLACKNGLSPFARSAFADVPTGTPRSPLFGAVKFSQPMPRLQLQSP